MTTNSNHKLASTLAPRLGGEGARKRRIATLLAELAINEAQHAAGMIGEALYNQRRHFARSELAPLVRNTLCAPEVLVADDETTRERLAAYYRRKAVAGIQRCGEQQHAWPMRQHATA